MPDRIPELDSLAAEAKEVPMMPADEVRRRGTRRRTTRLAGIAAGSLAVVAVAGFGIWQSPLADGLRTPQWADTAVPSPEPTETPTETPPPSPTPTNTETPTIPGPTLVPPTWDNLPTGEMLSDPAVPGSVTQLADYEGPGQSAKGLCGPGDWGTPSTFLVREYGADLEDAEPFYWAAVLGYDSAADADAGFAALHEAAAQCGTQLVDAGWNDPRTEDLSGSLPPVENTDADPVVMSFFGSVALSDDPDSDPGVFSDTLIVQAGERVLWVSLGFEGWDHNCVVWEDPDMDQCAMGYSLQDMYDALVK
ncbi:MAG TPA: hypothetical protein PKE40_04105 [Arachnia sp.]|nr:hypothetical protein [Arachnia sp.]HMT85515.1 hypothetical protein [Arachnia sp.]